MHNSYQNVVILYTKFEEALTNSQYKRLLSLLPIDQIKRNQRFVRWQDRHSHLFGRLLLRSGLDLLNYKSIRLSQLKYNDYNRPVVEGNIDFNISHSGDYVICAIGENIKLGIDIEKIQNINFSDFRKVMTHEQWRDIEQSENSHKTFFNYWTIKESVIKADSRGLSIPLLDLHVSDGKIHCNNTLWHIHELNFDNDYCSHLATDVENVEVLFKNINFYQGAEVLIRQMATIHME